MLRKLHGLPSLFLVAFIITLTVTGAILSLAPTIDRATLMTSENGALDVASLAQQVAAHYPQVEHIERSLSGEVIAYYLNNDELGADVINPLTGAIMAPYQPSAFMAWVKDLHRSFLLNDNGRMLAGVTAVAMALICFSGTFLLIRRSGGWKALFKPFSGKGQKRIHSELARFAILGLLLSSLTGSYMSAVRFGIFADHSYIDAPFPEQVSGDHPAPIGTLSALRNIDLNDLRNLVFPFPDDPQDVFTVTTRHGTGYVDQATGQLLNFTALPESGVLQQWAARLHTSEGIWWLGLILGASALTIPVLSYTGISTWWKRQRQAAKRNIKNVDIEHADTIILVGSEGNTTWGFARDLHANLSKTGHKVHCGAMNQLAKHYPQASMLFILTSTYGNGDAPTSANQFISKLDSFKNNEKLKFAVLGFGDQQFPNFCKFPQDVDNALADKGIPRLETIGLIDRSSTEQFQAWGKRITDTTGIPLILTHNPQPTETIKLELIGREDYGLNSLAATSILRFAAPKNAKSASTSKSDPHGLPAFDAGDLLAVLAPGEEAARFYSLASSRSDGVLEICVRKQPNGVCSSYLHSLNKGDCITGFIRHNPEFRPAVGSSPIILIGAGAGISPLAGFIRKNTQRHPMFLYWGGRNPQTDFLYQPDLERYLTDQRLTELNTAFSQEEEKAYVQDTLLKDQMTVRQLLEQGAQILVCGGRDMAKGVNQAINDILKPLQTDVDTLKAQGRYLEDVY